MRARGQRETNDETERKDAAAEGTSETEWKSGPVVGRVMNDTRMWLEAKCVHLRGIERHAGRFMCMRRVRMYVCVCV